MYVASYPGSRGRGGEKEPGRHRSYMHLINTMDGNTIHDCLGLLKPVTEGWHCPECFLSVSIGYGECRGSWGRQGLQGRSTLGAPPPPEISKCMYVVSEAVSEVINFKIS